MLCFRLFSENNPAVPLADAVAQLREGEAPKDLYAVEPASFQQIPNAPFAYWVSERIRRLFVELPAFEGHGRTARQGLATANDFRFVRSSWEPSLEDSSACGGEWFGFAKGGSYSPYYADIALKVKWKKGGEEIESIKNPATGKPKSNIWLLSDTIESFFFQPGLVWPRRTTSGLSMRVLPKGCVFADKGPAAFSEQGTTDLLWLLSIFQSTAFQMLLGLQLAAAAAAARSYEVGVIQRTAVPPKGIDEGIALNKRVLFAWSTKRRTDTATLTSHAFHVPALAPGRKPKPTR